MSDLFGGCYTNLVSGLHDISSIEILVEECDFHHLQVGVLKESGALRLRCSVFENNWSYNIAATGGALLNLNYYEGGGYNYFYGCGVADIHLDSSGVELLRGRNYFDGNSPLYLEGSLALACGSPCILQAGYNQWSPGLGSPALNKFNVTDAGGSPYTVQASVTEAIPSCGFYDSGDPNSSPEGLFSESGVILLFPIPAQHEVHIQFQMDNSDPVRFLEIHSLEGRLVYQRAVQPSEFQSGLALDLGERVAGNFTISFTTAKGRVFHKKLMVKK